MIYDKSNPYNVDFVTNMDTAGTDLTATFDDRPMEHCLWCCWPIYAIVAALQICFMFVYEDWPLWGFIIISFVSFCCALPGWRSCVNWTSVSRLCGCYKEPEDYQQLQCFEIQWMLQNEVV